MFSFFNGGFNIMTKLSYNEAKEIIKSGFPVKALIARGYKPVNNLTDLDNLIRLDKMDVQHCELYCELTDINVPDNAYVLSLSDAIELVSKDNEKVFSKLNGEELTLSSVDELISYKNKCILRGDPGMLYWYVN